MTEPSNPPRLSFEDRVAGAALGQAAGDALGFQVERQGPEVADPYVTAWTASGNGPEPMRDGFAMGQVSDDTQCSVILMDAVLAAGGYDPLVHARALVAGVEDLVGSGSNTRRMLHGLATAPALAEGKVFAAVRERDAALGHLDHLPTNGGVMRAWPHAVLQGSRERIASAVACDVALTHAHPESAACAVTCAIATRLLFEGTPIGGLLEALERQVPGIGDRRSLRLAHRLLHMSEHSARKAAWAASGNPEVWRNISPAAVPTVAWALYSLVSGYSGGIGEIACRAVGAGGDVDTTAALALGWYGAVHGPDAFPAWMARRVRDRDLWDAAGLLDRSRAFAALGDRPGADPGSPRSAETNALVESALSKLCGSQANVDVPREYARRILADLLRTHADTVLAPDGGGPADRSPVKFVFRERKALQILLHLIGKAPDLPPVEIERVLYRAEREHLTAYGRPIFCDTYMASPIGPAPVMVGAFLEGRVSRWQDPVAARTAFDFSGTAMGILPTPLGAPDLSLVSKSDIAAVDDALALCLAKPFRASEVTQRDRAWASARAGEAMDWALAFDPGEPGYEDRMDDLRMTALFGLV